ncbi:MAG: VOC family protein [Terrimicrobiaceae bacterium]
MDFAFPRSLVLVALATISNLPAQSGPNNSMVIPPPQVTEPTPIPLPPSPPATTPVFVPGSQPAIPGAAPGLFTPGAKPEMLDLIPTLLVRNMGRSVEYYNAMLGFGVVLQSGGSYTAIGRDFVQIGLALDKNAPKGRYGSCYIKMARVDVFYQELKSRGVKMTSDLKNQPSRMREFSVTDPDGNILVFGEYVGPK